MTSGKIQLEIVTPARQLVHDTVDSVALPSRNGELGILPGHAPLITELGVGELVYKKGDRHTHLGVVNGFAEVLPDRVIVLAEVGEFAEEIDLDRARKALERAKERLAAATRLDWDFERAAAAMERAVLRMRVASHAAAEHAAAAKPEKPKPH